jgi:hypothetical protein
METNSLATAVAPEHPIATSIQAPLAWSGWFRCRSSLSLALAPHLPGVFALAEEIVAADDTAAEARKRMLALLQVSATDNLAQAFGRLFVSSSPLRERLEVGRCFVRYAIVPDPSQREAVYVALLHWLAASSEIASDVIQGELPIGGPTSRGFPDVGPLPEARPDAPAHPRNGDRPGPPPPFPAGF